LLNNLKSQVDRTAFACREAKAVLLKRFLYGEKFLLPATGAEKQVYALMLAQIGKTVGQLGIVNGSVGTVIPVVIRQPAAIVQFAPANRAGDMQAGESVAYGTHALHHPTPPVL
jgi:hypothetical protein